jgi:hypothetical protein
MASTFAQAALNNTTANTAAGKIASSILSLMSEEKIGCDFLSADHDI